MGMSDDPSRRNEDEVMALFEVMLLLNDEDRYRVLSFLKGNGIAYRLRSGVDVIEDFRARW